MRRSSGRTERPRPRCKISCRKCVQLAGRIATTMMDRPRSTGVNGRRPRGFAAGPFFARPAAHTTGSTVRACPSRQCKRRKRKKVSQLVHPRFRSHSDRVYPARRVSADVRDEQARERQECADHRKREVIRARREYGREFHGRFSVTSGRRHDDTTLPVSTHPFGSRDPCAALA